MEHLTKSEDETKQLGKDFATKIKNGGVVFLYGELGAGKTTFVRAVAKALGIKERILSPTYTIVRKHPVNSDQTLFHVDLYRISDSAEVNQLGLEEAFENKKHVILIEWPEKLDEALADFRLYFERVSETERKVVSQSR